MAALIITHTAMATREYNLENMSIPREDLLQGSGTAETYRLRMRKDPFSEETESEKVEITIGLPPLRRIDLDPPPFLWNKEDL